MPNLYANTTNSHSHLNLQRDQLLLHRLAVGHVLAHEVDAAFLLGHLHVEEADLLLAPLQLDVAVADHLVLDVEALVEDAHLLLALDQLDAAVVAVLHGRLVALAQFHLKQNDDIQT